MEGFDVIVFIACACLHTVACKVESMQVHVYMCTHAPHIEHLRLHVQVSFTIFTTYVMLPSLAEDTFQLRSSMACIFSLSGSNVDIFFMTFVNL